MIRFTRIVITSLLTMNLPNSKTYLLTILKQHLTSLSIVLQRRVSPPRPNPPPKRPLSLPLSLALFLIVTPLFSRLQMKSQVMKFPIKKFLIVYGSSFKHECHLSFLASQPTLCNSSTATPPQSRPQRALMVYLNPKNSCWICLPLEILKKSPKLTGKMRGLTVLLSSKGLRRRTYTNISSRINTSFHNKKTSPRNLRPTNASTSGSADITLTPASSLLSNSTKQRSSS